jgi:hypothetical protein
MAARADERTRDVVQRLLLIAILWLTGCASAPRAPTPMAELSGVILDPEGVGVEGIQVFLDPTNDRARFGRVWRTGRDGSFRCPVPPGRYAVSLLSYGQRVADLSLDTIDVPLSGARLYHRYEGLKVQGRVAGDGRRFPEGTVEVYGDYSSRAMIHVAGKLVGGRYKVFLPRGTGTYSMEWSLSPPFPTISSRRSFAISADTTIDLETRWNRIEGRITVRGIAAPWSVGVSGTTWGPDTLEVSGGIRTGSNGTYSALLPSGKYRIHVNSGSKTPTVSPHSFSRSVPGPKTVATDLPAALWTGVVRDSSTGEPQDSIYVSAMDSRGSIMTRSDRNGRFRLLVEPGRMYTLICTRYRRGRFAIYRLPKIVAAGDSVFDLRVAVAR